MDSDDARLDRLDELTQRACGRWFSCDSQLSLFPAFPRLASAPSGQGIGARHRASGLATFLMRGIDFFLASGVYGTQRLSMQEKTLSRKGGRIWQRRARWQLDVMRKGAAFSSDRVAKSWRCCHPQTNSVSRVGMYVVACIRGRLRPCYSIKSEW